MFVPLFFFVGAHLNAAPQDPVVFSRALAVGGVSAAGRVPIVTDPIIARIVNGEAIRPLAGDTVTVNGRTHIWKGVEAGTDGQFSGPQLNGGYVYVSYDSPDDGVKLLEAAGDSLVYVNGEPRAGDPYAYGYLRIPVALHKGPNDFLFVVGRGSLKARLLTPSSPQQLDVGDLTMPDTLESDTGNLFGGVVVINSTSRDATDLTIACAANGKDLLTPVPRIPAMSLRKVRFDFPAGVTKLDLILMRAGEPLHSVTVNVSAKKPGESYRRTFVSSIDGSVQYYAVTPSTQPDKENALILSLHGASVEAIGQAAAYTAKPWATLVAPTNRRPYGFDWEDWGRMDAMEVLDVAGATFPHDPKRVVVTGHSMGGHGTWSIGTLYPSRFGATAPSAGWISFWSYAGGWEPKDPTPVETMLRRAMSPSDTLARVQNLAAEKVYILHGDQDDNVPVAQARQMRTLLAQDGIEFGYHEEPGAQHWWGNRCVDYPELMNTLEIARISDFAAIDFTTPDPGVSADCGWIKILQQVHPREISRLKGDREGLTTENVRAVQILSPLATFRIDGDAFSNLKPGQTLVRAKAHWKAAALSAGARQADFCGPLKQGFNERFVLVYGTSGSAEENSWSLAKAKYDAESFYYRGNGAAEMVSDAEFLVGDYKGRNVVVYGNADTNRVWKSLLSHCPIRVRNGEIKIGNRTETGAGLASEFIYPASRRLVVAMGGTGVAGMRLNDRLPIFTSGTAYPDWMVLGPDAAEVGTKGIVGLGFFGPDWSLDDGDVAWRAP